MLDPGKISRLFQDRGNLQSQLRAAQIKAGSLTLEHNRLVEQANRAPGGSSAQRQLHEQAQQKGRESTEAHKEADHITRQLSDKEIEIADLIDALIAASKPLLSTSTVRQIDEHLATISGQLGRIDQNIRTMAPALTELLSVVEDQGDFAREANDMQSGDISARLTELKSTLRQQVVEIAAVKVATARTTAAVKEISTDITRQVASSEKTTGPVVQQGWTPGLRQIGEERSPELSAETLDALPGKVTVLLFASEPRDQPPVSLDEEIREITEKINEARFGELIDLQPWLATRAFDVIPGLNQYRPHMVQFSGHGTPEGVLMMGPRNRSEPLAADRLMQMLKWTSDELRIAFFNICDSEAHARAAAEIFEASIGMRRQIKDMAARTFAAALYSGLAFGHSLQNSFQQACAAIGHLPDSAAPQLFFRDGIDPHKVVLVRPDS